MGYGTSPFHQQEEEGTILDTDEEPLAKVARLNTNRDTASSPAVTWVSPPGTSS